MANAKKATVETVELIKTTSTWTVPAGCKSVDVFLVGGGGGNWAGDSSVGGKGGSGIVVLHYFKY